MSAKATWLNDEKKVTVITISGQWTIRQVLEAAQGTVFNIGAGYKFTGNVDIRAEIPVIIIVGAPGEAGAVAPTFTATLGIRFK